MWLLGIELKTSGRAAGSTELTGSTNLITHYNLEQAYNKFCGKKVKEKLSNFLPDLPGMIDLPGSHDNSSLRSLIEKPPILSSSFNPITGTMLSGFRLHTGPLPEQCRLMHIQPPKKKNKHKHKQSRTQDPVPPGHARRGHQIPLQMVVSHLELNSRPLGEKRHLIQITKRRKRKKKRILNGKGRRKRRKRRRTDIVQTTQVWEVPRPAAAAASANRTTELCQGWLSC
ncbi:mediator of RNA polymerase II transcription subunit 19-like protein [Cricetulus griseus]|nr:mediator of RNA polymerase II transcription subunit 19-like protein [Cricetulus griseus]